MNKKTTYTIIGIIIALVIIFFAWKLIRKTPSTDSSAASVALSEVNQNPTVAGTSTDATPKSISVSLTDSGYVPKSISINAGDTVTFTNNSSGKMWTASGPHPQHTDYPGFDEKSAANNGESYSFTFTKVGRWSYHNHLNPSQFGTVIVNSLGNKD